MKFSKKTLLLFFNKHHKELDKFLNTMGVRAKTDLNALAKCSKQELNDLYQQAQYYFLLKEITTKRS